MSKKACEPKYQYDYLSEAIDCPALKAENLGRDSNESFPELNKAVAAGWYPVHVITHPGMRGNTVTFILERMTWEEEEDNSLPMVPETAQEPR